MTINVCDYWKGEGGCSTCPCNFMNIDCESVDKDRVIGKLEEAEENIQKMLHRLREP